MNLEVFFKKDESNNSSNPYEHQQFDKALKSEHQLQDLQQNQIQVKKNLMMNFN
jgi:hypothetical protein